jgi:alpha-galactosidase
MTKIAFIGAGSTVFAKNLMGDILSFPELTDSTISLMDIDPNRLRTSEGVAHKINEVLGANAIIEATTDRRAALDGADYAICMIQVGSYKPATVTDFDIPKKYGLRQTIADTLGIGGIMRALRTIPVLLEIAHDMEALCPDALFINYVNPMAMNQWALSRGSTIKTVGLCHSVPHTAHELSRDIGVPVEDINYLVAGINHMAFYLTFEDKNTGEDLYPRIRRVIDEGRVPDWNRVRYEMLTRLGYFVTESSEHFSESDADHQRRHPLGYDEFRQNRAQRGIRLQYHPQYGNQHATRHLWECAQYRTYHQSPRRVLRRGSLSCR